MSLSTMVKQSITLYNAILERNKLTVIQMVQVPSKWTNKRLGENLLDDLQLQQKRSKLEVHAIKGSDEKTGSFSCLQSIYVSACEFTEPTAYSGGNLTIDSDMNS